MHHFTIMYTIRILNINLKPLRNNSHFNFFRQLLTLLNEATRVKAKIQALFDAWYKLFCTEDEALKKIRKSTLTEQISVAAHDRDSIFRGMSGNIRAALNHFDKEKAAAARRLQIVMDAYGKVKRMSMDEKSAAIYNLMVDLEGKHGDDIKMLGLNMWTNEIRHRNDVLNELLIGRYKESASKTTVALREIRQEVDEAYRVMMLCIEALWVMAPDDETRTEFGQFIGLLNVHIEHYKNKISRRGRTDDEIDEGDDVLPPNPDPQKENNDEQTA